MRTGVDGRGSGRLGDAVRPDTPTLRVVRPSPVRNTTKASSLLVRGNLFYRPGGRHKSLLEGRGGRGNRKKGDVSDPESDRRFDVDSGSPVRSGERTERTLCRPATRPSEETPEGVPDTRRDRPPVATTRAPVAAWSVVGAEALVVCVVSSAPSVPGPPLHHPQCLGALGPTRVTPHRGP